MTALWIVLGVVWVACGLVSYGWAFAHFQRKYPGTAADRYWEDVIRSAVPAIFGPLYLVVLILSLGRPRHGFKWC